MQDESGSSEPGRSSIARNLVHLLSSQAITFALSATVFVVMPRFIDPEGLGQIRLATSLWLIAQVFSALGTAFFLTLQFAKDPTRATEYVLPVLVLRLSAALVSSVVLAGFVLFYDTSTQFVVVMGLNALTTVFALGADTFSAALMGLEQMKTPALSRVVATVFYTVGVVFVLLLGGGVEAVMAVTAMSAAVPAVILYRAYATIAPLHSPTYDRKLRWIVSSSLGFLAAGAVLTVYQQIDTVVISVLVDQETLGWYALSDTLFGSLLFVTTILGATMFPVFGRLYAQDPKEFRDLTEQIFGLVLIAAIPVGLGLIIIGREFAPLLFGEPYRPVGQVMVAFGPATSLVYLTSLLGTIAFATGREKFWNSMMVVAIIASIPLDLLLVPWTRNHYDNGAIGGALAYVVTESMILLVGIAVVAPFLNTKATWKRVAKVGVSGAVMFAVCWPLRDRLFLIPAVVGAVVYVAMILTSRVFDSDERAALVVSLRGES